MSAARYIANQYLNDPGRWKHEPKKHIYRLYTSPGEGDPVSEALLGEILVHIKQAFAHEPTAVKFAEVGKNYKDHDAYSLQVKIEAGAFERFMATHQRTQRPVRPKRIYPDGAMDDLFRDIEIGTAEQEPVLKMLAHLSIPKGEDIIPLYFADKDEKKVKRFAHTLYEYLGEKHMFPEMLMSDYKDVDGKPVHYIAAVLGRNSAKRIKGKACDALALDGLPDYHESNLQGNQKALVETKVKYHLKTLSEWETTPEPIDGIDLVPAEEGLRFTTHRDYATEMPKLRAMQQRMDVVMARCFPGEPNPIKSTIYEEQDGGHRVANLVFAVRAEDMPRIQEAYTRSKAVMSYAYSQMADVQILHNAKYAHMYFDCETEQDAKIIAGIVTHKIEKLDPGMVSDVESNIALNGRAHLKMKMPAAAAHLLRSYGTVQYDQAPAKGH